MHKIVEIASWFVLLAPFILLSVDITTAADNLEKQKKALEAIADFADRICSTIPLRGDDKKLELTGNAKAELNEFLKKVANLGIEGAAKYQASEWQGVLQQELAEQLNRSRDCKREVSKDLISRLLDMDISTPTPSPPTTALTNSPCPVLFKDDFDNGVGSEWIREGGVFHMADGQLTHSGPRGTLWLGKKGWTDVVVDVDVAEAGCGGDYTAILLRMQDTSNYMGVVIANRCVFATGGIYIIKKGQQTTLVQKQGDFGHWRIEAVGKRYRVFVGGQLLMSTSDDTSAAFTSGSVGIAMGSGKLDNFTVCNMRHK
jgi:hypothetical protein